jgi:ABC-type phosphate/phosphonate transport system ATPase subunit
MKANSNVRRASGEVYRVFDHIEQTKYLLSQFFESGIGTVRNVSTELNESERIAIELGMSGGAKLLRDLNNRLTALAAGQDTVSNATIAYCDAVSYYNIVAHMLVVETMAG